MIVKCMVIVWHYDTLSSEIFINWVKRGVRCRATGPINKNNLMYILYNCRALSDGNVFVCADARFVALTCIYFLTRLR